MIRRPPRSTLSSSSAASDVYKRQLHQRLQLIHKLGLLDGTMEGVGWSPSHHVINATMGRHCLTTLSTTKSTKYVQDFGDHVCFLSAPAVNVQAAENHSQYHWINSINSINIHLSIHLYNYGNLSAAHTVKMYENSQRNVKPTTNSAGDRKHRLNIELRVGLCPVTKLFIK